MKYAESPHPRLVLAFFCLVMLCTPYLLAQTAGTGAISGTVTDPAGAVVPRVAVTAVRAETGESRATTTDSKGAFRFSLLLPGRYQLKFSVTGFKAVDVSAAQVNVTETTVVDQKLEIGSQTQEVTVQATATRVQTETSTIGEVVGQERVSTLPLTNRNYTQILALAAGVQGSVNNAAVLGKGTQDVTVNGGTGNQNSYQQDGMEINNFSAGQAADAGNYSGIGVPNPDSIEEFKIQTSLFDAGYGRNPGANVNVVTKSGTNAFHGALWEFLRNTKLNANDFFQNEAGQARGTFLQNQFGGTFGGRIIKDKLFFFGSYQGTRQINGLADQGHSTSFLPPLTNNRSAAALGAAFCPQNNPGSTTFFPETVQVACDGSNINPVALNVLNAKLPNGSYYVPTPQTILPGDLGFSSFSIPAHWTEDQYLINTDYVISPKHTLSGRIFIANDPQTLPFFNGGLLPGDTDHRNYSSKSALVKLTSILSPNLVNEARISGLRIPSITTTGEPFTDPQMGITPIQPDFNYLSSMAVAGLFTAGGNWVDQTTVVANTFQAADQLSWTHGRQTIRTGFQAERVQWNWHQIGTARGELDFQSFADFLIGQSAQTNGSAFGLGNIIGALGTLYPPGGLPLSLRVNDFNSFVQDDIKVNSRLTLNLGMRWEFDGLMNDKHGLYTDVWQSLLQTQPIPPPGGTLIGYTVPPNFPGPVPAGVHVRSTGTPLPAGEGQPLTNFAPRFGLAWQPLANGRLVIRGGFGYFYDRIPGSSFANPINSNNPPFVVGEFAFFIAEAQGTLARPWYPFHSFGWTPRSANFATGDSSNLNADLIDDYLPTPLVQEYNLNMQYQLPSRMLLEVGYVGSHGIHQYGTRGINQPYLASPSAPINGITINTNENAPLRVPYVGFSPGGISAIEDQGMVRYNSLIASLKKSLSHGVQFGAAYTWNTDLTNLDIADNYPFSAGNLSYNNVNNARAMWGPSNLARAQRMVINYSWNIPGSHSPSGFVGKMSNGWSVAGVTIAQTGLHMTPTDGSGGTIYGSVGTATGTPCPGFTAAQFETTGSVGSRLNNYFNTAAFCSPATIGNGTDYGTLGQGDVVGPAQFNSDIAILKTTIVGGLSESGRLDFRAEFFNAFNHPQFANPGLAIGTPGFGQITTTSVQPRLIQFALKYIF